MSSDRDAPRAARRPAVRAGEMVLRDRALRYLLCGYVAVCVWLYAGWGGEATVVVLFWFTQVILNALFGYFCIAVSRVGRLTRDVSRFWRYAALGSLFFLSGDLAQTVVAWVRGDASAINAESLPILLVVAGVICVAWGMLRYPVSTTGRTRSRMWLDATTTLVGTAAFVWYFIWAIPTSAGATHLTLLVFGSALMLVCAFAVAKLLLFGDSTPFTPTTAIVGVTGIVLAALATAFGEALSEAMPLGAAAAVRMAPNFVLAATPRVQQLQVSVDPRLLMRRPGRRYSLLPYAAVIATQALLVIGLIMVGLDIRVWGVLVAVIVDTELVVLRQLLAFADNARLLVELDEAVLTTRRQEERFRSLVQHASDITVLIDRRGRITYASPATQRVLGLRPSQVVGVHASDLVAAVDRPAMERDFAALLAEPRRTESAHYRVHHAEGSVRWLDVIATNLLDDPSVTGVICNIRDVTSARRIQEQMRHEATHDSLTGLANRALFDERTRVETPSRRGEDQVGILVVDLDDFKPVNDRLGHHVGDDLLVEVARRLIGCVRPTDTVARLGGDEFAILLPGASMTEATRVATRVLEALTVPVVIDGNALSARASIGVAVGPRGEADSLLRASDAAMYRAKQGGKGRFLRAEA